MFGKFLHISYPLCMNVRTYTDFIYIAYLLKPLNTWTGWSGTHTHTHTHTHTLIHTLPLNYNNHWQSTPTASLSFPFTVCSEWLCWLNWVCLMIVKDHKQNHSRSLIYIHIHIPGLQDIRITEVVIHIGPKSDWMTTETCNKWIIHIYLMWWRLTLQWPCLHTHTHTYT